MTLTCLTIETTLPYFLSCITAKIGQLGLDFANLIAVFPVLVKTIIIDAFNIKLLSKAHFIIVF